MRDPGKVNPLAHAYAWIVRAFGARTPVRPTGRDPLGPEGEALAARHLKQQGYRIIGRNLRVPMGEADILALDPDGRTIVLVEVKCRRVAGGLETSPSPPPEASITWHKRRKLGTILEHLARANGWSSRNLRIDAVAVEWLAEGEAVVRHHAGAAAVIAGPQRGG